MPHYFEDDSSNRTQRQAKQIGALAGLPGQLFHSRAFLV